MVDIGDNGDDENGETQGSAMDVDVDGVDGRDGWEAAGCRNDNEAGHPCET